MGSLGGLILAGLVAGLVAGLASRVFTRPRRPTAEWDGDAVEGFLRVGRFTLDEWLDFSPETRAQIAQVARLMDRDRIVALASAIRSEEALVTAAAPLDGGAAAQDHIMGTTLNVLVEGARADALRARARGGSR